jgi:hypothetical protein
MRLGQHKWRVHNIKGADRLRRSAPKSQTKGNKRGPQPKKPDAAPRQAATRAAGPATDRAAIYTASLSMGAIAAYLALPPFDQRDLDICNAGLPNVGRSLAQLADTNPSVAKTCDLILAGGGGGWLALLMAVVPIAGAIAANHGALPSSSGDRFGEMLGMAPAVSAYGTGVRPTPPASPGPDRDASNVVAFFSGEPDTVMTDATTKMMAMGGPLGVSVPHSMTVTENPDGHRGSEQLRPVIPTAEPAPSEAVS